MFNFQVKPIVYKAIYIIKTVQNKTLENGDNKATSLEPRHLKTSFFFLRKKVDFIFYVKWRVGSYQKTTDLATPSPFVSPFTPQSAIYVSVYIQNVNTDDI